MSHDARAIANYFLDRAKAEGLSLTPMHVLKLVYIADGWHLAIRGTPLINDPVEVWDYGPVIPNLYHSVKRYGRNAITEPIAELVIPKGGITKIVFGEEEYEKIEEEFTEDEEALLNRIFDVYGGLEAFQLSALTHREGTPWAVIKSAAPFVRGQVIPNSLIKDHFLGMAARHGDSDD